MGGLDRPPAGRPGQRAGAWRQRSRAGPISGGCGCTPAAPRSSAPCRRGLLSSATRYSCAACPAAAMSPPSPRTRSCTSSPPSSIQATPVPCGPTGSPRFAKPAPETLPPPPEAAPPPGALSWTPAGAATLRAEDDPLLAELARDGRAPVADLAAATNWHESTVRRRIEELRQAGLLYFDIDVDDSAFGVNAKVMLWLEDRARQPRCGRPRGRRAPGGPVRRRHHRPHQPRRQRHLPRHPPAVRVPDHQAGRPARACSQSRPRRSSGR